jgi:hypothetical protein
VTTTIGVFFGVTNGSLANGKHKKGTFSIPNYYSFDFFDLKVFLLKTFVHRLLNICTKKLQRWFASHALLVVVTC